MVWFMGANVGTSASSFLTIGNAYLIAGRMAPREQIDTFVRPMLEGKFFGTMCLSEPQAGSSLSDIKTRAVKQSDGTYRLTGNKMDFRRRSRVVRRTSSCIWYWPRSRMPTVRCLRA